MLPNTLIAAFGYSGLVLGVVLTAAILAFAFVALPRQALDTAAPTASAGDATLALSAGRLAIWLALAACLFFFSGQTTVWAFVERLGANANFDPVKVSGLLSLTLVFAVLGSLTAAALADRVGNLLPFLAACTLFLIGDATLFRSTDFLAYGAGACIVMYSTGLGISYCVAEIARLDPDGRHVVLSVPAVGAGAMLGPGIAGFLGRGVRLSGCACIRCHCRGCFHASAHLGVATCNAARRAPAGSLAHAAEYADATSR